MLKIIGWCLKAAFFAIVVLVASHLITWNGRSVSDQVRSTLSSAERSMPGKETMKIMKKKSKAFVRDTKEAASKIGIAGAKNPAAGDDAIEGEDRQELQALIHSSDRT